MKDEVIHIYGKYKQPSAHPPSAASYVIGHIVTNN